MTRRPWNGFGTARSANASGSASAAVEPLFGAPGVGVAKVVNGPVASGRRPVETSVVCGPNVVASTSTPSRKRPTASPEALSLNVACSGPSAGSSSAHTTR